MFETQSRPSDDLELFLVHFSFLKCALQDFAVAGMIKNKTNTK